MCVLTGVPGRVGIVDPDLSRVKAAPEAPADFVPRTRSDKLWPNPTTPCPAATPFRRDRS